MRHKDEFMVVSDFDCSVVSTLDEAKETAAVHFDGDKEMVEVKIYKLVLTGTRSVLFSK